MIFTRIIPWVVSKQTYFSTHLFHPHIISMTTGIAESLSRYSFFLFFFCNLFFPRSFLSLINRVSLAKVIALNHRSVCSISLERVFFFVTSFFFFWFFFSIFQAAMKFSKHLINSKCVENRKRELKTVRGSDYAMNLYVKSHCRFNNG